MKQITCDQLLPRKSSTKTFSAWLSASISVWLQLEVFKERSWFGTSSCSNARVSCYLQSNQLWPSTLLTSSLCYWVQVSVASCPYSVCEEAPLWFAGFVWAGFSMCRLIILAKWWTLRLQAWPLRLFPTRGLIQRKKIMVNWQETLATSRNSKQRKRKMTRKSKSIIIPSQCSEHASTTQ